LLLAGFKTLRTLESTIPKEAKVVQKELLRPASFFFLTVLGVGLCPPGSSLCRTFSLRRVMMPLVDVRCPSEQ